MIHLEKRLAAKNQFRFYKMDIQPNLFGEWTLVRNWGRIGRKGQVRLEWFDTFETAQEAVSELCMMKEKRGYHTVPEQLFLF